MSGRIPPTFIDALLQRANIVEVIDRRLPLKRAGVNHKALCPFHNEKTPSFSVNEGRQFFHCFGCGSGGDAIGFIMKFDNVDFPDAVETLAREYGMEVPREAGGPSAEETALQAKLRDIVEQAAAYYHTQLREHPRRQLATGYLRKRGLNAAVIEEFKLGFAPPGWDNLLRAVGGDEQRNDALLKAGLIIPRARDNSPEGHGFYDRFRERIMFPIRDSRGRTIAFGGRAIGDAEPKYLNSPETPVFHKGSELYGLYEYRQARVASEAILLVEGYMDVIALAQMGLRHAVATLGTATSERQLEKLFRSVSQVVFCFDGDKAGRAAAGRALEASLPQLRDGRQVKFLFLPDGSDPDSYVRAHGQEQFADIQRRALPLEEVLFERLGAGLELRSIDDKARLASRARPLIARLPAGVYRELIVKRLSAAVDMDAAALNRLLEQDRAPPEATSTPPPPAAWQSRAPPSGIGTARPRTAANPPSSSAHKAVLLLLRNPQVALEIHCDLTLLGNSPDAASRELAYLMGIVRQAPDIDAPTLFGRFGARPYSAGNPVRPDVETITPEAGLGDEFRDIVGRLVAALEKQRRTEQDRAKAKAALGRPSPALDPQPAALDDRNPSGGSE